MSPRLDNPKQQPPCPTPGNTRRKRLPAVREPATPTNPPSPPNRDRTHSAVPGRPHPGVPEPPCQSLPRRRCREVYERLPKYICEVVKRLRHVGRFRVRIPVGPTKYGVSQNFGFYPGIHEAAKVRSEVVRRLRPGVNLVAVMAELRAAGLISPSVLAVWAVRLPGGVYAARFRGVYLPGPYPTDVAASTAMLARLSRTPAGRA